MPKDSKTQNKVKIEHIVQLPLDPGDGVMIKAISLKPDEMIAAIEDYATEGWSFALSRNTGKGGYSVFVGQTNPEARDKGYGFYANGNTPSAALACAVWKLTVKENRFLTDYGLNGGELQEFS